MLGSGVQPANKGTVAPRIPRIWSFVPRVTCRHDAQRAWCTERPDERSVNGTKVILPAAARFVRLKLDRCSLERLSECLNNNYLSNSGGGGFRLSLGVLPDRCHGVDKSACGSRCDMYGGVVVPNISSKSHAITLTL